MPDTIKSQYAGKCESNLVHAETIEWAIGAEIYLSKDDASNMWIKCTNKDCFLKQGGKIQAAGAGKFQSSKFKLETAPAIVTIAAKITKEYFEDPTHSNSPPEKMTEIRATFFMSIFKTLSGCYKP